MATPTSPNDLPDGASDAQTAADVIRAKVARLYAAEPSAAQEVKEAAAAAHRSPHQQFMYELSTSGKDLATVQTEWHNYYQSLPDEAKQEVWQEFYESQSLLTQPQPALAAQQPQAVAEHKHEASRPKKQRLRDARSRDEIRDTIRHKVSAGGKLQAKHHLQSLLFGLGMGMIVVIIFLFGFFNEVVIAPFIQPGRAAADTPLIISNDTVATSSGPEVIIPKINVQIPVDYNQTTIDERVLEKALDSGILHYPTTVRPGQTGNAAFFGHSSNNIFNKGKYKFAFVLLNRLVPGDTFYLTYERKLYAYKVIDRKVVEPSQVEVLNDIPGKTTATLITCDPPGTSLKRLVVVGEQISPDPAGNSQPAERVVASGSPQETNPVKLLGNGPTAWGRFIRTPLGKAVCILIIGIAFIRVMRWMQAPARTR